MISKDVYDKVVAVHEKICDGYCRFPYEIKSQEELDKKCDKCPFEDLREDIKPIIEDKHESGYNPYQE